MFGTSRSADNHFHPAFLYFVEVQSAGLALKAGNLLIGHWRVEWVAIGRYNPQARAKAEAEPMPPFIPA